jgi:uncharacterized protein (DUF1330 family)
MPSWSPRGAAVAVRAAFGLNARSLGRDSAEIKATTEDAMAAYLLVDLEVTDPAGFEEYRQQVPQTIAKYGGRYLVRGGKTEVLEGNWQPKRVVVLEFPSVEQARRWYDCEEYRGPKALRMKTARTNVILAEGAPPA